MNPPIRWEPCPKCQTPWPVPDVPKSPLSDFTCQVCLWAMVAALQRQLEDL